MGYIYFSTRPVHRRPTAEVDPYAYTNAAVFWKEKGDDNREPGAMKPIAKRWLPWVVLSAIWCACFAITGSVSFASTICGCVLFVALMGLLYT